MPDQPSGFTVTDRRKFTLEGDLREGASTAEETPTAATQPKPETQAEPRLGPKLVQNEPPAQNEAVNKEVVNRNLEPLPAEDESLEDEAALPEPTAAESAQQDADYRASSRKLDDMISQANPGARDSLGGRGGDMNFDKLVQSLYMTAALQMGAGAQPGEQPRVDILGARQSIDMLSVLVEKTKGNLTEKEQRLLQNALFELRMMFMEITNAISTSAHNPAAKPPMR
ncbi:MAG TPA: DUF1844 domain-containing protein [Acetobacteraceae bacterium]|nr:DUF1844 domain-containing protein [Acetobacteraceae bacterium]